MENGDLSGDNRLIDMSDEYLDWGEFWYVFQAMNVLLNHKFLKFWFGGLNES